MKEDEKGVLDGGRDGGATMRATLIFSLVLGLLAESPVARANDGGAPPTKLGTVAFANSEADDYLDIVATNACWILFEMAIPAGKLKCELISLATHDGRPLTLTTPRRFSACPVEVPRAIFERCLANKFIERDRPYGPDSVSATQAGRSRADLARAVGDLGLAASSC